MDKLPSTSSCLIVDDEADIRELLVLTLERMGIEAISAGTLEEAFALLEHHKFALCLTDMRLPDGEGLTLVQKIGQEYPGLPVAVITAYGSTENAVAALKAGAFDYLAKPISLKQLRPLVQAALNLSAEIPLAANTDLSLIGESPAIRQARAMIEKVARSQAPVYISGESGSGKELAARMVHGLSSRASGAFIPVNCGAIPENLMESEFFGHKKGSFTGALQDKEGFFHAANGGTLFLDEVADLPLAMQVKLLRAIQEKKVRMVGTIQEETVDVRIISATHRNLAQMMERSEFRQDLYYRLNVIEVKMPALREMAQDIPAIADTILNRHCHRMSINKPILSNESLSLLQRQSFPGNVRELENMLERALALCDGEIILPDDLLLENMQMVDFELSSAAIPLHGVDKPLPDFLEDIEKKAILNALEKTNQNKTAAAQLLGVSFRTLRYRLAKLGLGKAVDDEDEE